MELSPETRDRLNKFKETALQLALLALIVMVLGFVVWLIWSQREAFIAWWKHTFPPRCEFTDWSDWAACTKSCGVGSNSANRSYGPQKCKPIPGPSELQRKRQCELEECLKAVNCQLGPWSSWASCSEECGPGIQNRLRREIQAPNALGRPCPLAFQEWPCQNRLCSHFCRLSPWSPWGPCSTSCGRGKMTRHRTAIPRDEIQSGIECPKEVDESACSLGECIEQSSCHFEVAPRVDRAAPLKGCNGTTAEQGCHLNCAVGYEEDRPLLCAGGLRFLRSRCLPTSCGEAPTIVKGRPTFRCAGLQSGAMCHIDCDPGFQKTGDLFCHHGHFNVPDCRPDSCGRAPQPSHGAALFVCPSGGKSCSTTDLQERTVEDCTGLKYGEVCDFFTCRSGYFKSEELRCDRFNFNRPRCVEDLCRKGPPEVAHAVVDFDDGVAKECRFLEYHRLSFPSRAVCPVSCDEGFQAHGASFCVRGQWYAAECVQAGVPPVGCKGLGAPQVKNAAAVLCPKDLYYTSQVCEVKCDNGFRKTADLLCAPDGWLDAECLPAECRAPIVDNAEDLSLCAGSPHGSQCRVRCLEGFEASADHLVCDHGVWSYVLCEPRRCRHPPGAPPFAVGNFSACAGKLHGEYCKLTCEDGFDPVPSDGMRCERGRFSAAACEPRACPMPLVNNSGDLSDCFQHPSGSICELLCARGYVKAGANLYCDRGKWSPGACWPTPGCGAPPTVAHAESAEIRHCVNVARGERCDGFRCDVGFEAAAGESLSCLKHGAFSRPHCIRQRCGKPTLPPNGRGSQGCEGCVWAFGV